MMNNLVVAPELGKVFLQRIQAVRAVRDDLANVVAIEGFHVARGKLLENKLLAHAPCGVARAAFLRAEDRKPDAGRIHQADKGASHAPHPAVVGGRAADPVEDFEVGPLLDGRDVEPFRPLHALFDRQPPWIVRILHASQRRGRRTAEPPFGDEVAAHLENQPGRINPHGTHIDARRAGRARPESLGANRVAVQLGTVDRDFRSVGRMPLPRQRRPDRSQKALDVLHNAARRQRLAAGVRGACFLTAAALHARVQLKKRTRRQNPRCFPLQHGRSVPPPRGKPAAWRPTRRAPP